LEMDPQHCVFSKKGFLANVTVSVLRDCPKYRCESSSDESEPTGLTPAQKRRQMLADMAAKKRRKAGRLQLSDDSGSEDEEASDKSGDDRNGGFALIFRRIQYPSVLRSRKTPHRRSHNTMRLRLRLRRLQT
jgi:hypothetical protein